MISGSIIETQLCDKLKAIIDTGIDYTPQSLLTVINASPLFDLQDLIAWVFNCLATKGPTDISWGVSAMNEAELISKVNVFLDGAFVVTAVNEFNCQSVYGIYYSEVDRDTTVKQNLVTILLGS